MKEKHIYVVGDIHGNVDDLENVFIYLSKEVRRKGIDKKDIILVYLGDFGFNFFNNKEEKERKAYLFKRIPFLNIVVLGNHENYDEIYSFSTRKKLGASCFKDPLVNNLYYVKNGEVLTINNKKFRCYGGGLSIDKEARKVYELIDGRKYYWEEEIDTNSFEKGIKNYLDNDIFASFTHDAPFSTFIKLNKFMNFISQKISPLQPYFEKILSLKETKPYRFLGHFHPKSILKDEKTFVLPIAKVIALDDLINFKGEEKEKHYGQTKEI